MKSTSVFFVVFLSFLIRYAHPGENALDTQLSNKSLQPTPSMHDIKIRATRSWVTVEKLLVIANEEVKLRKPRYPITDIRPTVLIYPGDPSRIASIRYDIPDPTRSNKPTSIPLVADIAPDLSVSIRETRLENDLPQTSPSLK